MIILQDIALQQYLSFLRCEIRLSIAERRVFFVCVIYYRQLPALTALTTLCMRNTQRTNSNIPEKLDALVNLVGMITS